MNRKLGSHRLVAALAAAWLTGTAVCAAVEVDGFTQPYFDVDVAASETGLLAELQVREGDRVRKGQLLASLDDAVLQATLEIAKQTMDSLGRLESAEAELRLQVDTVNKLRQLHSRRHASDQELERAEAQRTIAEARLRAAREEHRIRALECERARIQLQQSTALPVDDNARQAWQFDLPFRHPEGTDDVMLRIERRDRNPSEGDPEWAVNLAFEFDTIGTLQCRIALTGDRVATTFWCERETTLDNVERGLPSLRAALEAQGLEVVHLHGIQGRPAEPMIHVPVPASLLDERA